jgi:hypothetical protein
LIGVHRIHGILLKNSFPQQSGSFQYHPLAIWQRIRTDKFHDL